MPPNEVKLLLRFFILTIATSPRIFENLSSLSNYIISIACACRWGILDGNDPFNLIARSEVPILSPSLPWERGVEPYECVVPNVVFVQVSLLQASAIEPILTSYALLIFVFVFLFFAEYDTVAASYTH